MKVESNVKRLLETLTAGGFEAAVVGGAVRDILSGKKIKDWDFATNATPEQIQKLFPHSFYNNRFGTVGVLVGKNKVEITTYRKEQRYSDLRHPDVIVWANTIEEDLGRRDFTINAMALRLRSGQALRYTQAFGSEVFDREAQVFDSETQTRGARRGKPLKLVDPFGGQKDLKSKIIRTVGDPQKRFSEDALRLLRTVRFATTLGFRIEEKTLAAIKKNAQLLLKISGERVRDELFKIIDSKNAAEGILLLKNCQLLAVILPELDVCFSVEQKSPKRHHIFDVGTHCVESLRHCPSKKTIVRLATLLHDIGKAKVAKVTEEGVRTFYNHEVIGGRMALSITKRLNLSRDDRDKLFKLVRYHQFTVYENQTDRAIRRFIRNIGVDNIEDMMDLRIADRLGGGLQQPEGWRLRLFRQRLKEVMQKPFTVADLKVNGNDVMKILGLEPGPKVGEVLKMLFEEVVDDSTKNNRVYLLSRIEKFKS